MTTSNESSSLPSRDGVDSESMDDSNGNSDNDTETDSSVDSNSNSKSNENNAMPLAEQDKTDCNDPIAYYQNNNPAIMSYPSMGDYHRLSYNELDRDKTQPKQEETATASPNAKADADSETKRKATTRIRRKGSTSSSRETTNRNENSDNSSSKRKATRFENQKSIDGRVSSAFYLWKKVGKKRRKYPTVQGQFDDAPEQPRPAATAVRTRDAALASLLWGHYGQIQPHTITQAQQMTQQLNSPQQFAVDYLQNKGSRDQHQQQQLLELYQRQHQQMNTQLNPQYIQFQHQQQQRQHQQVMATVMETAAITSQHQQQTLTKFQMELHAKIIKAQLEYNQALLDDATKNRRHQLSNDIHTTRNKILTA